MSCPVGQSADKPSIGRRDPLAIGCHCLGPCIEDPRMQNFIVEVEVPNC